MNKLFSLLLGLVLLMVGLAGCSDSDGTTGLTQVSGRVLTYKGRQPVSGAMVEVVDAHGGANMPIGAQTTADANGRFSLNFEAQKESGYPLMAYTAIGPYNDNLVVPVNAPAWVRIHVVDELPRNQAEVFMYGYGGGGEPGGQGDRLRYPRDTVLVRELLAEEPALGVYWCSTDLVTGTGADKIISQHFNISPLDTTDLRIAF
jgi:hypothetical protein